MSFNVDDIVKKISGTQKYVVKEVLTDDKYKCKYYPDIGQSISFVFKGTDLELAT